MAMNNYLRLKLNTDDDGTCELVAEASSNGFSGKGSAWFSLSEIKELSTKLLCYPIPEKGICLKGGFFGDDHKLEEEHLSICIYRVGETGNIGLEIKCRTPSDEVCRPESIHRSALELITNYQDIEVFSKSLSKLVDRQSEEALLQCDSIA